MRNNYYFVKKLDTLNVLKQQGAISDEEYKSMLTALTKEYYPDMDDEVISSSLTDSPDKM